VDLTRRPAGFFPITGREKESALIAWGESFPEHPAVMEIARAIIRCRTLDDVIDPLAKATALAGVLASMTDCRFEAMSPIAGSPISAFVASTYRRFEPDCVKRFDRALMEHSAACEREWRTLAGSARVEFADATADQFICLAREHDLTPEAFAVTVKYRDYWYAHSAS